MFITPLEVRALKEGKYQLLSDLKFKDEKIVITVYAGFVYDMASIPSGVHDIMGCPADYAYESALHDALYASRLFSRKACDKYWYKALISFCEWKREVGRVKALTLYKGVRIGGEQHYGSESISNAREFVSVSYISDNIEDDF